MLGTKRLESLSPADVRAFLTGLTRQTTAATARESHRVLRSALASACREELISRNVASLVDPPAVEPRLPAPWTLAETLRFLDTARGDPLYAAFMLALALGLRRGEIVGLRWVDVDLDSRVVYVRRQVQRVRGDLYEDDPKGRRRRPVPLPRICVVALRWERLRQAALRRAAGERWHETGYVFTTRTGRPVEARNIYRSFGRLARKASIPIIRPRPGWAEPARADRG
jgi:integrase